MPRRLLVSLLLCVASLLVAAALFAPPPGARAAESAHEGPQAFVGARLIPVEGPEIAEGVLVVDGGRIVAIGPLGEVAIPEGATRHDARGRVIMPGLVCTHSHVGGTRGADGSAPIQPGVRVLDSINVLSSGFRRALAGGLTTLNLMPGSGHLSSGQTVYVKLRYFEGDAPRTIDELLYVGAEGEPLGGLKMANGTNPRRNPPFPGTRGKAAALVRERFLAAEEYRRKLEAAGDDESKRPPRDLDLEALAAVLSGERVVHHHTHRHDDIMTVLRLAKEFDFEVVLHHVTDGFLVADEIAKAGAPVSGILVDSPGGKHEAKNLTFETPGVLERAGVLVALHTDDPITDSRLFLRMGAYAVRAGMTREGALAALTINGAKILDLEERIGSLAVGKDADLAILDGDPFANATRVVETWVEGRRVFELAKPEDRLYAEGGFGATHDVEPYFCCAHEGLSKQLLGGGAQ